jgi:hypothetical protein
MEAFSVCHGLVGIWRWVFVCSVGVADFGIVLDDKAYNS